MFVCTNGIDQFVTSEVITIANELISKRDYRQRTYPRDLSDYFFVARFPSRETMTPLMMLLKRKQQPDDEVQRCNSMRPAGETLAPLLEGPTPEDFENGGKKEGPWASLQWMKGQLLARTPSMSRTPSMTRTPAHSGYKRSDIRLLLGVLGAPLAPVSVSVDPVPYLSIKNVPMETSSAQYIVQQYVCATGVSKLQSSVRNSYAMGRVKMLASEFETATKVVKARNSSKCAETGCFVLWQLMPDMWSVEMAVGGSKVHAGSNGKLVWRHTPWLGSHAAKGPVRPLRRALQGLDPRTIANVFSSARCVGEKKVRGEDCFILKLATEASTLAARSDGPAEIIRHVLFGFFSQKTGLLVQVEDSHLTRIQSVGGDAAYWETTMDSSVEDYRMVDGIMIAHGGRSVATLFRFGEVAMSHTKTRMEEVWTIEEVAFNVPGLSEEGFIPPADIRLMSTTVSEISEFNHEDDGKCLLLGKSGGSSRVAALEKPLDALDNIIWRVEV